MFDRDENAATAKTFLEGHYTLWSMAKEIENVFGRERMKLLTEINQPNEQMVIQNTSGRKVRIDAGLAEFLGGTPRDLQFITCSS